MRQAVRDMVDFLVREKGIDPYDAYSLLSLAGDVRVSRTFRPNQPRENDALPARRWTNWGSRPLATRFGAAFVPANDQVTE